MDHRFGIQIASLCPCHRRRNFASRTLKEKCEKEIQQPDNNEGTAGENQILAKLKPIHKVCAWFLLHQSTDVSATICIANLDCDDPIAPVILINFHRHYSRKLLFH